MFRVLSIDDKEEWKNAIAQCSDYDFYHTWDYHHLSLKNSEGKPRLFIYENEDRIICFPLLEREVEDKNGDQIGVDYTSVYGYAGPVFSENLETDDFSEFSKEFYHHLESKDCISVFSRLHPTIDQNKVISHLGDMEFNSKTIQIDLTQTLPEQRKHYRKSNKSEINKLRKTSEIVWSDLTENDLDDFIEIYNETMERVGAKDYYFFDKQYYINLFNAKDYKTELVFVVQDGVRIAASLFIFCKNIIQYHLAGTRNDYIKTTPMKLILDEVRLYGTEKGYKTFHLGGGTSTEENDPLFRFKRGFSKIECDFSVFKKITNQEKYNHLVSELENASELNPNYFPLYRA